MRSKNISIILIAFLGLSFTCFSQVNKNTILSNLKIKKIITYQIDSIGDSAYVSNISFLNSSGKVVKEISLNKEKDTTDISIYQYDKSDKILFSESKFDGKRVTYNYKQLSKYRYEAVIDFNGKISKSTTKQRKTVGRWKIKYYVNGKLDYKETIKTRKKKILIEIKKGNGDKIMGIEYLDSNKNVKKSKTLSYLKYKFPSSYRNNGRQKNKTIKYTMKQITLFDYNTDNLLVKKIKYPSTTFKIHNFTHHGTVYSCRIYKYLTE